MILIFIGPSGSGKDTQAQMLQKEFNFEVVSSGELLRDISSGSSRIQKMIKDSMNRGFLSDNLVYGILEIYIGSNNFSNIILTGVVRRLSQIKKMNNVLSNVGRALDKVVYFSLSNEEAEKRLGGRRICSKCNFNHHLMFIPPKNEGICDKCGGELITRADDKPKAIHKRLEAFHEENDLILEEYRKMGFLVEIDASPSIDLVYKDLVNKLNLE